MLTAQQKAERLGRITGSRAAACLGIHPRKTPLQAWHEIMGRAEETSDDDETPDQERGSDLEDFILDRFVKKRRTDLTWDKPGFRMHSEFPWIGSSTDAIFYRDGQIAYAGEVKTIKGAAFKPKEWGPSGSAIIPPYHEFQARMNMIAWPETTACLFPIMLTTFYDFEFRDYEIPKNEELHSQLVERINRWHRNYVVANKEPPARAEDYEYVRSKFPVGNNGSVLEGTEELAALALRKRELDIQIDPLEKEMKALKTRVAEILEDYESSSGEGWQITYKNNQSSEKVDTKAIVAIVAPSIPEIIAAHTKVVPGQRKLLFKYKENQ